MYVCVCMHGMCVHANQVWLPLNLGLLEEQIFNMVMNNIYKQHYFWLYLKGKINGLAIFFIFGKQAVATMRRACSLYVGGKLSEYVCLFIMCCYTIGVLQAVYGGNCSL